MKFDILYISARHITLIRIPDEVNVGGTMEMHVRLCESSALYICWSKIFFLCAYQPIIFLSVHVTNMQMQKLQTLQYSNTGGKRRRRI